MEYEWKLIKLNGLVLTKTYCIFYNDGNECSVFEGIMKQRLRNREITLIVC